MKTTKDIRDKLIEKWAQYEAGEIDETTARTHIGFARATLDTLKVEVAAAHLSHTTIPAVKLDTALTNLKKRGLAPEIRATAEKVA